MVGGGRRVNAAGPGAPAAVDHPMAALPPRPAAVLFDLDGTLLDSAPSLAAGVAAARGRFDLPPLDPAAVAPHVGRGLGDLLRATLPAGHHHDLAPARAAFHAAYRAHLLDARPMPGADALLSALGPRAGLVTNKPRMYLEPLLAHLGWRFGVVVDGDHPAGRKPEPEPLRWAARALGYDVTACAYVGDSLADRDAAEAAGMPFVAVVWGRVPDATHRVTALAELDPWA